MKSIVFLFSIIPFYFFSHNGLLDSTPLSAIDNSIIQYSGASPQDKGSIYVDADVAELPQEPLPPTSGTLQLLTHGKPGQLLIEDEWKKPAAIVAWLQHRFWPGAYRHLNIYGCEFAKGPEGLAAVQYLEQELGVSVAASTNITGRDGDWMLEVGHAADAMVFPDFQSNLQCTYGQYTETPTISWLSNDNLDGSTAVSENTVNSTGGKLYSDGANVKYTSGSGGFQAGDSILIIGNYQTDLRRGPLVLSGSGGGTFNSGSVFNNAFPANAWGTVVYVIPPGTTQFSTLNITGATNDGVYVNIDAVSVRRSYCYTCSVNIAPTLSATTISNVCPAHTYNLSAITASNTPAGTVLTWHTGTPANNANKISTPTAANGSRFYAAFYHTANACYSGVNGAATSRVEVAGDFDCDGVINDNDIDDDNDGVLDTQEGLSCYNYAEYTCASTTDHRWVTWTSTVGITDAYGYILLSDGTTVNVHYQGDVRSFQPATELNVAADFCPYSGANGTSAATMIQTFSGVGVVHRFEFSAPVIAPVFHVWSLGAGGSPVNYTFTSQTKILESNGALTNPGGNLFVLSGSEGDGSVLFDGVQTVIQFTANTSENWSGLQVSVGRVVDPITLSTCTSIDTDNDGTANHLDLDSDNDDCSDAKEAGATTSSTANYQFATTPDANGNGLNDSKETGTTGTINYGSTYSTNGVSTFLNACTDTDSDAIGDLTDIDDDNDGVLDATEAPNCYYTTTEAVVLTKVSTGMTSTVNGATVTSGANIATMHDGTSTTVAASNHVFTTSQALAGANIYTIELPTAANFNAVNVIGETASWGTSSTATLKGSNDAITWTTLMSAPLSTTTGTTKTFTVNQNAAEYRYYRIEGVAVATSAAFTNYEVTATLNTSTYIQSAHPKATCATDTDSDGTTNNRDRDSDGDTCSDAKEAGATTNGTLNYQFDGTPDANANGLDDDKETGTTGTINYSSTYGTYATSSSLNVCADTDNDSIGDLVDIDDDNDGVLDAMETNSECEAGSSVSGTNVSLIGWMTNAGECYMPDERGFWWLSETLTTGTNETYLVPAASQFPRSLGSGLESNSSGANCGFSTKSGVNPANPFATNHYVEYKLTTKVYAEAPYLLLRRMGWNNNVSSQLEIRVSDDNFLTYTTVFTPKSVNNTNIIFDSLYVVRPNKTYAIRVYLYSTVAGLMSDVGVDGIVSSNVVCNNEDIDTDNDGISNRLDLDSDGDGCSDAKEAGATTSTTTNYQFAATPDANTNGLNDSKETGTTGTINYGSTYSTIALSTFLNACADTDSDTIGDLTDIDDDNDGSLDATEAPLCYYTATEANVISKITSQFTSPDDNQADGDIQLLHDGSTTATFNFDAFTTGQNPTGSNLFTIEYPTAVDLATLSVSQLISVTATANAVVKGSNDGTTWSAALSPATLITATPTTFTITTTVAYKYYRIETGSVPGALAAANTIGEITSTLDTHIPSAHPKSTCATDTDSDGTPNSRDLDSDGDGCSDARESGATTSTTTNYQFDGTPDANANGLDDDKETGTSSTINYSSTYNTYAIYNFLSFCTDTDGDGIGNLSDIDDDNDGVLDAAEAPSCYYTKEQANTIYKITSSLTSPDDDQSDGDIQLLHDLDVAAFTFNFSDGQAFSGATIFRLEFPTFVQLAGVSLVNATTFGTTVFGTLQGSVDGVSWSNLSSAVSLSNTTNPKVFAVSSNAGEYLYYRILGSGGSVSATTTTIAEITITPSTVYTISLHPKSTCAVDTDNDGITNDKDLDSDGDTCPDAVEAGTYNQSGVTAASGSVQNGSGGSVTSTTPTANAVISNTPSGNGFANILQAAIDTNAYKYIYSYNNYATNSYLNFCTDTDSDGAPDPIDLDADNDGVLNATEAAACYYTTTEANVIATITSDLSSPDDDQADGDIQLLHDGALSTYTFNFNAGQALDNTRLFTIKYSTPIKLTSLTINNNTTFGTGVTADLQASVDGLTWVTVALGVSMSTTSDKVFTSTDLTNYYSYYRVYGIGSPSTVTTTTIGEITSIINTSGYNQSAHPKSACSVDTDSDGTPNNRDLDSDGDGCSDAKEAGATTSTSSNYQFATTPDANANGLNDGKENGTTGTINYASTYPQYATTSTYNGCTDTDTDGIGDVADIDDDNDGSLDAAEAPACYYTSTEANVVTSVTSGLNSDDTQLDGDIQNLHDNNTGTTNIVSASQPLAGANIYTLRYPTSVRLSSVTIDNTTTSWGTGATARLYGSLDGQTWFSLMSGTTDMTAGATKVFTVNQNAGDYLYYRIVGVATATSVATTVRDITSVVDAAYAPSPHPKTTCTTDTDSDGTPNNRDRDSDGDGCSDAKEAGATASTSTNYQFDGTPDANANGLDDDKETGTTGAINYTSTYNLFVLRASLNACADADGDSSGDLVDIDDDNDGVLDYTESNGSCTYIGGDDFTALTFSGNAALIITAPKADSIRVSGNGGWTSKYSDKNYSLPLYFEFTLSSVSAASMIGLLPAAGTQTTGNWNDAAFKFYFSDATAFDVRLNGSTGTAGTYTTGDKFSISIDAAGNMRMYKNGVLHHSQTVTVSQYKLAISSASATVRPYYNIILNEQSSLYYTCADRDTDGDTTPNRLDLDSDGDTCSDAKEAGATTDGTTNYQFATTPDANGNGLNDNKEIGTTGAINYGSVYNTNALSTFLNACTDTDSDAVGDLADIDDDNDGVLDATEAASCYYTTTEAVVLTKVSTGMTTTVNSVAIATGADVPTMRDGVITTVAASNHVFTASQALAGANIYTIELPTAANLSAVNVIGETASWGTSSTATLKGSNDAITWTTLMSAPLNTTTGTTKTFTVNQNAAEYRYYRIEGVAVATSAAFTNYEVTATLNTSTYIQSAHPKTTCATDTDSDGTTNNRDLDSDGDTCSDAKEASATTSTTTNYQFAATPDTNGNGLNDSKETGTTGTINYTSSYSAYATYNTLNACTDTDSDGAGDLVDIDDDNDGSLDATEAPTCYYTSTQATTITAVTSGLASYSSNVPANTIDNNAATYNAFNGAINWVGQELYRITPTISLVISSVQLDLTTWALSSDGSQTFKLQGSVDGTNWTDLSAAVASTATTGTFTVTNALQPSVSYGYYRLIGVAGNSYYGGVTEIRLVSNNYVASAHPKTTCTTDTDNDGTLNQRDLDSDGDGCSDAKEAGATTDGTTNYQFATTPDANGNGLNDTKETGTTGTINYGSVYSTNAVSTFLNACSDSDSDAIGDLADIDDDNDGSLDAAEAPACYYATHEAIVLSSISTGMTSTVNSVSVVSGADIPTMRNGVTTTVAASDHTFAAQAMAGANIYTLQLPTAANLSSVSVYGTTSWGTSTTATLRGSNDGITWTTLMSAPLATTSTTSPKVFTVNQNAAEYLYYRIEGVAVATSAAFVNFEVTAALNTATYNPSAHPKPTCTTDTDSDGTTNNRDLDSDGDGCSDAREAGATTSSTSNYQFATTPDANGNGLNDSKETGTTGTINYASTYPQYATTSTYNGCTDTDTDGTGDVADIDDDNDGVVDATEASTCYYTAAEAVVLTSVSTALASTVNSVAVTAGADVPTMRNGVSTSVGASDHVFAAGINLAGANIYTLQLTTPANLSSVDVIGATADWGTSSTATLKGSNDGTSWTTLMSAPLSTTTGTTKTFTVNQNAAEYRYYRIEGVAVATSVTFTNYEVTATLNTAIYYNPSAHPKTTCATDTDSDGTPNNRDLDSDGDGCSDAKEAAATTSTTTNYQFSGTDANTNGLIDSKETGTTGTINYASTYTQYATTSTYNGCTDTDSDGTGDVADIDDDNDGSLDAAEAPTCYYTSTEANVVTSVTSGLTTDDTQLDGDIQNLHDGSTGTTNIVSISQQLAGANIYTLRYPTAVRLSSVTIDNTTTSWGTGATARLQGSNDGQTWTSLMSGTTDMTAGATKVFTVNQNAGDYLYYRIIGVATSMSVATTVREITSVVDAAYVASAHPKTTCATDTDSDGTVNQRDLDSDGDGCSDAKEAGATTSSAANYQFAATPDANGNGLNDSKETGTTGTINYSSTYNSYAIINSLNACLDTDSDGAGDLVDIDDDNDGVLDVSEMNISVGLYSPKSSVIITTQMTYTYNGAYTLQSLVDGVDNAGASDYVIYNPTGTFANTTWLKFEFPTAQILQLIELGHYPGQYLFATSSIYNIEGSNDNAAWTTIVAGQTYTNTTQTYATNNSAKFSMPSNTTAYKYYRIQGVSGSAGNGWAQEAYFYRNSITDLDTDSDGIVNRLDLDSDGDGCSDALEAGATASTTTNYQFDGTPDANTNGLDDDKETGTSGTINYGSTYSPYATSNVLKTCTDLDVDGVNDLADIDDDNDGSLDATEAAACYYTSTEAGTIVTVTSGLTSDDTQADGDIQNLHDNNTGTTNIITASQQLAGANLYTLKYPTFVRLTSVTIDNTTTSWGTSATARLQGSLDGLTWVSLMSGITDMTAGATKVFTVNQNAADYQYYRIIGVATSTSVATTIRDITSVVDAAYVASAHPKTTCAVDTDSDGTTNNRDLDSDGDGCSDAKEASATTSTTTNYQFATTPDANGNGLNDSKETGTSSTINYTSTYSAYAIYNTLNACTDTDSDGAGDLVDIDDDNDGVLDATEAPTCYYTSTEAATITAVTSGLASYSSYVPANTIDNNAATLNAFNGALNWVGQELYRLTATTSIAISSVQLDLNTWALSSDGSQTFKLQGSVDGTNWTDLSAAVASTATTGTFTVTNTLQPTTAYGYYRLIGVAGNSNYGGVTEIRLVPNNYVASAHPKTTCTTDTDSDGILNQRDPDSDGDGCSDAKEAGATTDGTTNYQFATTPDANGNGLNDTKETGTTGTINYTSIYMYALSASHNMCTDSDGDGVSNLLEIDDDNDGVLDVTECPASRSVTNGTFDTNSTGWTISPALGGVSGGRYDISTDANFSVEMSQSIGQTNPGDQITVSMSLGTLSTSSTYQTQDGFDVYLGGQLIGTAPGNIGTMTTYTFSTTTTSISPSTLLKIVIRHVHSGNNDLYIDNIQVSSFVTNTCTVDTDSDGITNDKDLDSDGDGCSDAKEAGATTSTTSSYQFATTPDANGNGLNDTKETGTTGTINYGSTYSTNAISTFLNACSDSDSDTVADLADIDDDNDGTLDATEAASCYYTATEAVVLTKVSTGMTSTVNSIAVTAGVDVPTMRDGTSTTVAASNHVFTASQALAGANIYTIELPTAANLTAVNIIGETASWGTSSTATLKGSNDAITWTTLMSAPLNTTTGTTKTFTVNQNAAEYRYYRIEGVAVATSAAFTNYEVTATLNTSTYNPSAHPKTTCATDTDSDGTTNNRDLDSDGDGCSDAKEAGATTDGTTNYQFATTPDANGNGLNDTKETGTTGTINYGSTYSPYATSSVLNACVDTDNDSIGDLVDIDDDNDGTLDATEAATCYYTTTEAVVLTSVSTTMASTVNSVAVTAGANVPTMHDGTSTSIAASNHVFTASQALAGANIYTIELPTAANLTAVNVIGATADWGTSSTATLKGSNDAITWMTLMSAPLNTTTGTTKTFTVNQNAAEYRYYRIEGVAVATSAAFTNYEVTATLNTSTYNPSAHPKATCATDTDSDGTTNNRDLDSDGDGCSDAREAGATTSSTSNYQFATTPDTNGNGLNDTKETGTTGTINYTSTYSYAIASSLNLCLDTDNDGMGDILDIDDDNDGVLDMQEGYQCTVSDNTARSLDWDSEGEKTTATNLTYFSSKPAYMTTGASLYIQGGAWRMLDVNNNGTLADAIAKEEYQAATFTTGNNKIYMDSWVYYSLSNTSTNPTTVPKVGILIDDDPAFGSPIVLNDAVAPTNPQGTVDEWNRVYASNPTFLNKNTQYYVRFYDVNYGVNLNDVSHDLIGLGFSVGSTSSTECGSDIDTDSDGIPNRLDLDSDGDGCSDAKEAGATSSTTANYQFATTPDTNGNGLNDTKETGTTGTINYTSTYSPYAISGFLSACNDTDADGANDLADLDDDNDGILDATEASSCYYTTFEAVSPTKVSTGMISTLNSTGVTSGANIPTMHDGVSTSIAASNHVFTAGTAMAGANIYTVELATPANLSSVLVTGAAVSWGTSSTATLKGSNDGTTWTTLMSSPLATSATSSPKTFTVNQNAAEYLYYRIEGVAVATSAAFTNYEVGVTLNTSTYKQSAHPKPTCATDTDSDGVTNNRDLDSDGDGCSDAYETGVSGTLVSGTMVNNSGISSAHDAKAQGPYGANGFANALETSTESGTYTGSYTNYTNATNNGIHTCTATPQTKPDVNSTFLGVEAAGDLSINDTAPVGTTYGSLTTLAGHTNPDGSVPTLDSDGTYTFTPTLPGIYKFLITVCPPSVSVGCPTEVLSIEVMDPTVETNKPFVGPDFSSGKSGESFTVMTLANDKSGNPTTDLDPTSVMVTDQPSHGQVSVDPLTGDITYTPTPGFTGVDTLIYTVCDNASPTPNCNSGMQLFSVLPASATNSLVATDDYDVVANDGVATGNVLDNDSDPDGDNLTVVPQTTNIPGVGIFTLLANGTYSFDPVNNFVGPANFMYQVCDDADPTPACAESTMYFLVSQQSGLLPVKLISFSGYHQDGGNQLEWLVADAVNLDYFELLHSVDGVDFEVIAKVAAQEANNAGIVAYQHLHTKPNHGNNYYRLVSVDYDGTKQNSNTINIPLGAATEFVVYPNPVGSGGLVVVQGNEVGLSPITLFNAIGQDVTATVQVIAVSDNTVRLNLAALPEGIYLVKAGEGSGRIVKD